jgi:hypothetical protein
MRYFFNLAGAEYDPDNLGDDLPTMHDARLMAAKVAGELLRDRPGLAWTGEELRVEVTDSDQRVLFTVIIFGVDSPGAVDAT